MASWQLRELGIDPERAAAALDFLESYGDLCASEIRGATPDEESEWSFVELAEDRWVAATDGASAYREAAQWAAALADPRAPGLLGRSADLFALTQQAYGLFLGSACQRWEVSAATLPRAEHVRQLATILGVTDEPVAVPESMQHPQQQAYAFLAAAGSEQLRVTQRELLRRIGEAPAGRHGSAPVGALGMPVRAYWEIAYATPEAGSLSRAQRQSCRHLPQIVVRPRRLHRRRVSGTHVRQEPRDRLHIDGGGTICPRTMSHDPLAGQVPIEIALDPGTRSGGHRRRGGRAVASKWVEVDRPMEGLGRKPV